MDSIQQLLEKHIDTRSVVSSPNSSRAAIICDLVDFMEKVEVDAIIVKARKAGMETMVERVRKKRARLMKYWLGRTKNMQPGEIYDMMSAAKKGRNPQALFNHLLKNERKENSGAKSS